MMFLRDQVLVIVDDRQRLVKLFDRLSGEQHPPNRVVSLTDFFDSYDIYLD